MTVHGSPPDDDSGRIGKSYRRVVLTWLVTLAALYAFQEYFT